MVLQRLGHERESGVTMIRKELSLFRREFVVGLKWTLGVVVAWLLLTALVLLVTH